MCELLGDEFWNETMTMIDDGFTSNLGYSMSPKNFCNAIQDINKLVTQYLLHIMHIPVIILIVITIFGKEAEDAKWFVFHTAILNFILGVVWELTYFVPTCMKNNLIRSIMFYCLNLATNSIFPLAFTRFLYLYFSHFYEKIFTKKTLIPWIFFYDVVVLGVYLAEILIFQTMFICLAMSVIMTFGTVTCSSLVFIKIRKMMNMVKDSKHGIKGDLRRAAIVCLTQGCIISLYLFATLYKKIYLSFIGTQFLQNQQMSDPHPTGPPPSYDSQSTGSGSPLMMNNTLSYMPSSIILLFAYIFIEDWSYTIYQFFIIIDTLITLLVLRTYRHALLKVGTYVFDTVSGYVYCPKYKRRVSVMYRKRLSVNQWTG